MSNQKKTCPICPNHCVENALHCEKGKSYFQGDQGEGHLLPSNVSAKSVIA